MLKSGFLLTHHWAAPLYDKEDPEELFRQVTSEMSNLTNSEEARVLLRQTGLVSLWFFLKYIAGFDGPYNELNTGSDLEIANFRQSAACMENPFSALFAPRKFHKSTITTHGAEEWEIIRDPQMSVILSHAVKEQAHGFFTLVKDTFEKNAFFRWLYGNENDPMGCFCPSEAKYERDRWNENEIVVPNRPRREDAATLECLSVGGTAQGKHPKLFDCDDLIGENDLNADRGSSADMWRARNWLKLNYRALPKSGGKGRTMLKATRYGIDDAYEDVFQNVKQWYGYVLEDLPEEYKASEEKEWHIFFRAPRENGVISNPDVLTEQEIEMMQRDDPWTWFTQMENKPWLSGLAELHGYPVKRCWIDLIDDNWVLSTDDFDDSIMLADLDILQTGDPAGSEKYSSARTSRQAQCVMCQDWDGNFYVVSLHADYAPITRWFDWLFEDKKRFSGLIRVTHPECQGGFKTLGPILQKEERERGIYLNLVPIPKTGDKEAYIREHLVPVLERGRLYICDEGRSKLVEELASFPQGRRKDVLDTIAMGIAHSYRPLSPAEQQEIAMVAKRREAGYAVGGNVTGY